MTRRIPLSGVLATQFRVLFLRFGDRDLGEFDSNHLAFGLLCTWIVGIGRYWDHPDALLIQYLGIGSLAYVFVLSAVLWTAVRPLRPARWSYAHLLTFVTLTALPGVLYAIPVERFLELGTARALNFGFLACVAIWRVSMFVAYLKRYANLRGLTLVVALLLPLCLIIAALTGLNLERAVFDLMAGLREKGTANDAAYMVLVMLTILSVGFFPVLLLAYAGLLLRHRRRRRDDDVRLA